MLVGNHVNFFVVFHICFCTFEHLLFFLKKTIAFLYLKGFLFSYRTWTLGNMSDGTPVRLVARTEHDGVMLGPNGEVNKLTIKAFNEWDSSVVFFVVGALNVKECITFIAIWRRGLAYQVGHTKRRRFGYGDEK